MAPKKNTEVWFPGKAYEVVMASDFATVTGKKLKTLPAEAKVARGVLKAGERRNKGRGYRVLVTLDPQSAVFLCQWFNEFISSAGYRKLGTAEALAVRTLATRLCEVATLTLEQKERQKEANSKRQEAMAEGRRRAGDEKAALAATKVRAYREWVKLDAQWFQTPTDEREVQGLVKPILTADMVPGDDEYALARSRKLI